MISVLYNDTYVHIMNRMITPDPVIADAHAGLINCDVICYSNAIFQGIASCAFMCLISCKLHQMMNIEGFHSITNLHL